MRHRLGFHAVMIACGFTAGAMGQCITCGEIAYDATTGLPPPSCFALDSSNASVLWSNGTLFMGATGTAAAYQATSNIVPFYWSDRLTLEIRVRVTQGSGAFGPGFRAAALVLARDSQMQTYGIAVWPTGVAFTSHWNFQNVTGQFVSLPLDAATDFRTYAVVSDPNGAQFFIDGMPAAYLFKGATDSINQPYFAFGTDTRFTDPSATEWRYAKLSLLAACPGDIDCDREVTDSDFVLFANQYELLVCDDPAMPVGCPADFNHDLVVDDADFLIFAVYYNTLVCDSEPGR